MKTGRSPRSRFGDQVIRGTLKQADAKGNKQFTTTRVEDPKLTEELEAKGVKYTGELANRWLPDLSAGSSRCCSSSASGASSSAAWAAPKAA